MLTYSASRGAMGLSFDNHINNYIRINSMDYENQLHAEYLIREFSTLALALGPSTVLNCMDRLNPEALNEIKLYFNQNKGVTND